MRSRTSGIVSDRQVQGLAEAWLREALPLEDMGWKCTARVLWQIVMLAAARMVSLFAACRDLAGAPSDDAVRTALIQCLPQRPRTLEEWLEPALAGQQLPKALFARGREVAIDWHLIPYHGQPHQHANELDHSLPKSGTTKFHCYATACIIEKGFRYTLAATYVKGNESLVEVLERLLLRMAERGLVIKTLLLDRQFFTVDVLNYLQSCLIPFVMPLVLRGKKPKRKQSKVGRRGKRQPIKLRDFQPQAAGRYAYTWTVKKKNSRCRSTWSWPTRAIGIRRRVPAARRSCSTPSGGCAALLQKSASCTVAASASNRATANWAWSASAPAPPIRCCGCSPCWWRWCCGTRGSGCTSRTSRPAKGANSSSIWSACASTAC